MITRRNLLAFGMGALAAPLSLFAQQQGKVWRVGILATRARPASLESDPYGAIPQGMRALGYIEGKNIEYEWRFAGGDYTKLPKLAAEIVQLKVDLIVAVSATATRAAQQATQTIPIVMGSTYDPLGSGFVATLSHPGGNITGISSMNEDLSTKHLELLMSIMPRASRVAVLLNFATPGNRAVFEKVATASRQLKVSVLSFEARTSEDIKRSFSMMKGQRAEALIVARDPFFLQQSNQIAGLAADARLPAIYPSTEYAGSNGLLSYGVPSAANYKRAAVFVDKILKGAKPGDLPVEQPTQFELVINMKTAKALGIAVPQSILLRADRVIE